MVLLTLAYLITVISFIVGVEKLPPTSSFSLGRWHRPVVVCAVVWLFALIGILTIPEEFHTVAMIAGGVIAAGISCFFVAAGRAQNRLECAA